MMRIKLISPVVALMLLCACGGAPSNTIPTQPGSQVVPEVTSQGVQRCIVGRTCPTPTPPPVFVVDNGSSSVKVYTAPYTAAPATMLTVGLNPTDAAYDSVSNQLVVDAGTSLLTYGAPFSSGETSLSQISTAAVSWRLAMMVPQSDAIQITPSLVEYASPYGIGNSQVPLTGSVQGVVGFGQAPGAWYPTGVMAVDRFGHAFFGESQGGQAPYVGVEGRTMSTGAVYVPRFDITQDTTTNPAGTAGPTAMAFDVSGDLWVAHYDINSYTSTILEFGPQVAGQAPTVINTIAGLSGEVSKIAFSADNLVVMLPREILVYDTAQSNTPFGSLVMGGSCATTTSGCGNVNMVIDHQLNIIVAVRSPSGSYIQVYSGGGYTQNQQPSVVNTLGNLASPQGMTGGDFAQIRPLPR